MTEGRGVQDFPSAGTPVSRQGAAPRPTALAQQPGEAGGGSSPSKGTRPFPGSYPVSEVASPRAVAVAATSCYKASSVLKIALYH